MLPAPQAPGFGSPFAAPCAVRSVSSARFAACASGLFGKQDLPGATKAWEQVIAIDPSSPEAQAAKRALDTLRTAHGAANGEPKPGA